MGAGVTKFTKTKVKFNFDVGRRRQKDPGPFRLDVVYMSRAEVEDILLESSQKTGSYILYEDLDKQKMYLALKRLNGQVSHHFIHCYNDLYYFDDFPFPYIESIVLYYSKHKFKDTKFTQQAFIGPYLSTGYKSIRRQLVTNRRHSSSTMSTTSSCKTNNYPSFHTVNPELPWSTDHRSNPNRIRKCLAASTPNISLDNVVYLEDIKADVECESSDANTESTVTKCSQISDKVTIDSDSGYAVSVNNFKNGKVIREKKNRTRARVTPSFRMLTDAKCTTYRQRDSFDDVTCYYDEPNDQSYVTKL